MRTGVRAVHQALTAEVASVLKHSLDLATSRGHAQVTPLHVAATLISSSDLLRRACLKSHPHLPPAFHRRALELCFNVALHRLPAAAAVTSPSLSNSLIAAIKRAQASQRRGCIDLDQQQPPSAIKVGMEQLTLSILDDPNVSRVMKEAGFYSSCVKSHLEEDAYALSDDLRMVMEAMLRKQGSTNTVVVGDSGSSSETLVAELISKLGRSEIPDELRHAGFLNLQLSSSHLMRKADVESKVSDLRRTINSLASVGNGIIIYAGDLSWAVDDEATVALMGRLLSEFSSSSKNRVWLLATASFGTYRKCQKRQPSLEILWLLQAVVVPSGWLGLGLQPYRSHHFQRSQTTSQVTGLKSADDIGSDLERSSKRLRTEERRRRFDLNFEPYVNVEEETECVSFHLPRELLETSVELSLNAGK